jgi:predicted nucleotide-binding protein (sugar kinase/HSP70/actin superfamily)
VPARSQRIFLPQDRKRTLIAPYFSPFYSPLVPAAFRPLGYNVEILPPQDKASVEFGLKNVNNEICYPAVLIAGDIIKAFKSGRYDPSKTSVLLTQTGGQCRASNYISLLKKALFSAGLIDVPIVAISMDDINYQPGFDIDLKELIKRFVLGSIFSDSLSQMFLSTIVREKEHGIAQRLHSKYLEEMKMGIERADYYYLLRILKEAVMDFNAVKVTDQPILKIGVVGEIFVKYNFFANGNIIDWLTAEGVEVVLPTLQSFFTQRFVNKAFDQRAFFKHSYVDVIKTKLMEIYVNYHLFQIESVMHGFRFYKKPFNLKKLAEITENVVSMANQFGEGWILTADIIAMLEENIGNIVCLQPFGCISNHITGKGMENRLKEMFPHMNLLSLDMDAGVSRVNILNRLQFLVMAGKEEMEYESKVEIIPQVTKSSFIPRIYPVNVGFINNYISPEIEKWKSWVSNIGLWKKANRFIKKF